MTEADQTILAVNEAGDFEGEYIPKMVGHTGQGKRHLAISVLLYNSKGEVLLQERKHKIFDKIWDVTGATHPLHKEDGSDESVEDATRRCLDVEYGITEQMPLKNEGFFDYFAQYGDYCENEHCAIVIGEYNGEFKMNSEVGYSYKWMDKQKFMRDVEASIGKEPPKYSPWAIKAVEVLKQSGFFNS